jgi:hypothetical protein
MQDKDPPDGMDEFRERHRRGLKQGDGANGSKGSFNRKLPLYLSLVLIIGGAYLLYDLLLKDSVERFWERNAAFLQAEYPEVDVTATLSQLDASQQESPGPPAVTAPPPEAEKLPLQELEISLARQFKVKELLMPPVSRELKTTASTDFSIKKMPDLAEDATVRYALLKFSRFGLTQLVLVTEGERTSLYVDTNHNLDLSDDGPPLVADSDAFAVTLVLPMYRATGIMGLDGEYRLWIYRPAGSDVLRYYPLTQLAGRIVLDEGGFDALVIEGEKTDANFLNDSILVDWNADGEFDPASEEVQPGQVVRRDDARYRFSLVE